MVCNFRADQKSCNTAPAMPRRPRLAAAALAALLALAGPPAGAERADRTKPMVVEAEQPGTVDLLRQVVVFSGNVVVTQGTMVLRADRLELRELPDGFRAATALGTPGRPASWQQKRDGLDEIVQGTADRIDFDGRADTLRFTGNGVVRRVRGTTVSDEVNGALITWDNTTEVFTVQGGAATAANPAGRVRVVLTPPPAAVSGPAGATPAAPAPLAPALGPSRQLGPGATPAAGRP
jgi:lipopolysaccharide export system protein LptA